MMLVHGRMENNGSSDYRLFYSASHYILCGHNRGW